MDKYDKNVDKSINPKKLSDLRKATFVDSFLCFVDKLRRFVDMWKSVWITFFAQQRAAEENGAGGKIGRKREMLFYH